MRAVLMVLGLWSCLIAMLLSHSDSFSHDKIVGTAFEYQTHGGVIGHKPSATIKVYDALRSQGFDVTGGGHRFLTFRGRCSEKKLNRLALHPDVTYLEPNHPRHPETRTTSQRGTRR